MCWKLSRVYDTPGKQKAVILFFLSTLGFENGVFQENGEWRDEEGMHGGNEEMKCIDCLAVYGVKNSHQARSAHGGSGLVITSAP